MDSSEVVCKHTASLRESEAHHGHMSIVTTFCRLAACLYDRTRHCCQGACAGSLSQCRD